MMGKVINPIGCRIVGTSAGGHLSQHLIRRTMRRHVFGGQLLELVEPPGGHGEPFVGLDLDQRILAGNIHPEGDFPALSFGRGIPEEDLGPAGAQETRLRPVAVTTLIPQVDPVNLLFGHVIGAAGEPAGALRRLSSSRSWGCPASLWRVWAWIGTVRPGSATARPARRPGRRPPEFCRRIASSWLGALPGSAATWSPVARFAGY